MIKLSPVILGVILFLLTGCSRSITKIVFGVNSRANITVSIFEPSNDTILVIAEMPGSKSISYHTKFQSSSNIILKNINLEFSDTASESINNWQLNMDNYEISTSNKIDFSDTSTWIGSKLVHSNSLEYLYWGSVKMKKREFNRWYGWTRNINLK